MGALCRNSKTLDNIHIGIRPDPSDLASLDQIIHSARLQVDVDPKGDNHHLTQTVDRALRSKISRSASKAQERDKSSQGMHDFA